MYKSIAVFLLVICIIVLTLIVSGCETPTVATAARDNKLRWYCAKLEGRGETGADVECQRVKKDDSSGDNYYDGPPVPLATLDPAACKVPPRSAWSQFWYDWGGWVVGIPLTAFTIWDVNHEFNRESAKYAVH